MTLNIARADAERERHHGDGGESRSPAQRPAGIAHVLRELFERGPAPHVARHFFDHARVAELQARRARGVLRALPARNAIGDRHPQMPGNLLIELVVLMTSPERRLHASLSPARLRMPAIAADSWVQRDLAATSCFRPAAVS
jgi:hypothetical protein